MIFKARLGRVLAGAFGAILALTMATTAYAVTDPKVHVVNELSKVTVHVFNNGNVEPGSDAMGSGNAVGTESFGSPIQGATLSYCEVGKLVQYTTDGKTSLKYAVDVTTATGLGLTTTADTVTIDGRGYYLCDASNLQEMIEGKTSSGIRSVVDSIGPNLPKVTFKDTVATDDNGAVIALNESSGIYLFIGKSMPSQVTTEIAPFFVSAPMPADGGWNTNIHVYPKVQTADKMEITHTVKYESSDAGYVSSMSANSGTPLEYQIVVTVPENVKNLEEFSVAVELPDGLNLESNSGNLTSATGVTLDAGEYTLTSTDGKVDFSISENALAKFDNDAEESTITITYEAKINNTASLAASIDSTATLTYKFKNAAEVNPAPDATATVYTYGIDLTKTFEGATEYPSENAQFSLYTDQSCSQAVAVSGSDGSYWVDSSSSTIAMDVVQLSTTADGALTIKGLAAGTYYLKEVAAPGGYGKLQDPIKITIAKGSNDDLTYQIGNPTAKVNDVAATIDAAGTGTKDGLVQLTVENQQLLFGFLPKTGDVGTFIFIAAGIGLVCAAVVYLTSRRRKNISNSH